MIEPPESASPSEDLPQSPAPVARKGGPRSFVPPPAPVIDAPPAEPANAEGIAHAVAVLKSGGLVAFPTETVYGLGADASNPAAVSRIFKVKGRPASHPVIVHLASVDQLADWASEVPEAAQKLAAAFWPGPLTIVLRKSDRVPAEVTGGQDTVALRVPAHAVALELLAAFGGGIAGPSANRYGRISPTTADHVRADLGRDVDLVLDGGPCDVGIESTIVDLSREAPVLLRPGRVRSEDLAKVLGQMPLAPDADAPRAPGSHESHYAPRAALKIVKRMDFTDELATHRGRRVGILALEISVPRVPQVLQRVLPASAALYSQQIYAKLRELDDLAVDLILLEAPPSAAPWAAVHDRIRRAEHSHAHGVRAARGEGARRAKGEAATAGAPPVNEEDAAAQSPPDVVQADGSG